MKTDKSPRTILDALEAWAEAIPEKPAFISLDQEGRTIRSIGFRELEENARAVGLSLSRMAVPRARVALMYPPGIDFILGFLGCLYADAIAVPVCPPRRNRPNAKAVGIVEDCGATVVLTESSAYTQLQGIMAAGGWPDDLILAATDGMAAGGETLPVAPDRDPDSIAMLQYTSGSTSNPKGVTLTHANLMSNLSMLRQSVSITDEDVFCCWVPHFHDMGLIGHVLQCVSDGCTCVLIAPSAFINRPRLWLEAISRFGVTAAGSPSFGFRHCVEKISVAERAGLDLRTWKVAYNGAEPVSRDVLLAFHDRFSDVGFALNTFNPCYGLAEATLLATGGTRGRQPVFLKVDQSILQATGNVVPTSEEGGRIYVGCGRAVAEEIVSIVDPVSGEILEPLRVGEVLLSGPNVMTGYWNRREDTDVLMRELAAYPGRSFLRTGDLGFVDQDGELFLTGRIKDLIILNGVNYYPQDIERTVEASSPDLMPGGSVAFSIQRDGREALALGVELRRTVLRKVKQDQAMIPRLADSICRAVGADFEIPVSAIAFLKPGAAIKTSSGKIARQACRAAFLSEGLEVVASWSPDRAKEPAEEPPHEDDQYPSTLEQTLAFAHGLSPAQFRVFNALVGLLDSQYGLGLSKLDITKSIFFYGIDSVKIIDIHATLEKKLQSQISSFAFFHSNTFAGVVEDIAQDMQEGAAWMQAMSLFQQDVSETARPVVSTVAGNGASRRLEPYAPGKVLVTGATGFLGAYLLREILATTSAETRCLVRAWDEESGLQRIRRNLRSYGLDLSPEQESRIQVILGDVSKPQLGLDQRHYRRLAEEVDGIYHCAAIDNFYLPYEMLRGANFLGIKNMFELGSSERVKPVFYTSSCAVSLFEPDLSDFEMGGLVTGYAQSKFVGEQFIYRMIERGHPTINYRLGYLYGSGIRAVDHEEAFETLIDSIDQIGCVPSMDAEFDLTPVEYAAKCILSTSLEVGTASKQDYTFYNPTPMRWSDVISYFLKTRPSVRLVSLSEFVKLFHSHAMGSSAKRLKLLKAAVSDRLGTQFNRMFRNVETDTVQGYSHMCPPCDARFTEYYLDLVLGNGERTSRGEVERQTETML